jgi:hypothetical protein
VLALVRLTLGLIELHCQLQKASLRYIKYALMMYDVDLEEIAWYIERRRLLSLPWVAYLADSGHWISDEHVDHTGAAEAGMHDDHPLRLFAYFADDLGVLAAFCVA